MKIGISVIMSVYNENINQLEKSIYSILNQDFWNFEFIIVLDNPNNSDAKKYILNIRDQRIIFLENTQNKWLPFSLNKAIKISKWKYIARMDADDVSDTERFKKQFNYLENNNKIDLLFTGWSEIDEKSNKLLRIPQKKWFKNINKYFFLKSMILHPTLMCKSEVLKNYNYPLTQRPEDFILFLDLIKKWYHFDIIEEDLFLYTIQKYDIKLKFNKINIYSKNFLPVLLQHQFYYKNVYFWYYVLRIFIEYILSRNFVIFKLFYVKLFHLIKKISI